MSRPTYHKWRRRYGGLEVNEVKGLRQLQEENRRLKRLVADQALNIQVLKEYPGKRAMTVRERRRVVGEVQAAFGIPERRAIRFTGFSRSSIRYRTIRDPMPQLRARIREIAAQRPRWGYRRIHVMLGREGWVVNRKRVLRLYREEGLMVRRKGASASESGAPTG